MSFMTKKSLNKHDKPQNQAAQLRSVKNTGGRLFLVATPIGNLGDFTNRAIEVLKTCDLILAEDTRVTKKLLSAFGIQNKIQRADEEAMESAIHHTLLALHDGKDIALVSDAGTPCVSDPGQRLAAAIIEQGFEVYPIPGASSVLAGLVASGLESKQFAFLGFTPNKSKARIDFFNKFANLPLTLIFFETGPRLVASLGNMLEVFGNRKIAVVRELTKLYEEKRRGTINEVLSHYQEKGEPKGEIVIIIEGASEIIAHIDDDEIASLLKELIKTMPVKAASLELAKKTGRKSREIYEIANRLKKQ
jgi:16S rRNA (cytidine1402-2'-O)-methyltransferase